MATTFAERLRWARYNGPTAKREGRVIGATILTRQAGCAQSLISGLERNNAKGSEHNNKFADVLGVDRGWLATGDESREPEGFDENTARKLLQVSSSDLLKDVHGRPRAHGRMTAEREPRWFREATTTPSHNQDKPLEYQLLDLMQGNMTEAEKLAVWTLINYLKTKKAA